MPQLSRKNAYYEAFKNKQENYDENEFWNSVKTDLKFSYGNVSLKEYTREYSSEGWLGRKVSVPPRCLVAIVQSIIIIVSSVFRGIPNAFRGDPKILKGHIYALCRIAEGFAAQFITLFNDRVGTYLYNEAGFHIACYVKALNGNKQLQEKKENRNAIEELKNTGTIDCFFNSAGPVSKPVPFIARQTTLLDMRNADPSIAAQVIEKLQLQESVRNIEEKTGKSFYEFLASLSEDVVRCFTLADLYAPIDNSTLQVIVNSDQPTVDDINAYLSRHPRPHYLKPILPRE